MTVIANRSLCLLIGFALDLLLGDPHGIPHPVRGIGALVSALERGMLREGDSGAVKRRKGAALVVIVLAASGGLTFILLALAYRVHRGLGLLAESVLCYQLLAVKSLRTESMKVYRALRDGDTERARQAVSMIVGRDTERLDEAGIARAAVETVAENTSDGVVAPLFYMVLGGALGGVLCKAVNTMDSMLGYKSERYRDFGRCAAKLDDAVNFLPSRVAAVLMIVASALCKPKTCYSAGNALRVFRRDRYRHASPNSAQTESVCAGALGLRLAGDAWYFGQKVEKPYIGDDTRPIEPEDIPRANRLLYGTALLMWALCEGALAAAYGAARLWL